MPFPPRMETLALEVLAALGIVGSAATEARVRTVCLYFELWRRLWGVAEDCDSDGGPVEGKPPERESPSPPN